MPKFAVVEKIRRTDEMKRAQPSYIPLSGRFVRWSWWSFKKAFKTTEEAFKNGKVVLKRLSRPPWKQPCHCFILQ